MENKKPGTKFASSVYHGEKVIEAEHELRLIDPQGKSKTFYQPGIDSYRGVIQSLAMAIESGGWESFYIVARMTDRLNLLLNGEDYGSIKDPASLDERLREEMIYVLDRIQEINIKGGPGSRKIANVIIKRVRFGLQLMKLQKETAANP